jgi:hypothetical protein
VAIRIILACIVASACFAFPANAQDSVKRAVFENCEEATKEFSGLSVEQQTSLADFFARVVALSTQSPTAPEAFAAAPGVPAGTDASGLALPKSPELVTGALWQSLDAKRELKAKRCALELLRSAGGLALHALPTLAQTYADQSLSDEIAVGVEETVADVAERAHKQGMAPSPEACSALGEHLFSERSLAARNVVQEFLATCLPHILATFPSPRVRASEVTTYLQEVDPSGAIVMRAALDSSAAIAPEKMSQIIPLLPLPDNTLLTPFVNDFIRLAADPSKSETYLPPLGAACVSLKGFTVDASQQAAVSDIPGLLSPNVLTPEQVGCLLTSIPGAAKRLSGLLSKDSSPEQQRHALQVMNLSYNGLPSDVRSDLCSRTRERALDLKPEITELSLLILKQCSDSRGDNSAMALTLLKTLESLQHDPARRDTLYNLVVELLEVSGIAKDRARFAPFIKPALASSAPSQSVLRLASKMPELTLEVVKRALEIPPSPGGIAALKALAATKMFPKKSIQSLVDLLRYPEVQLSGEETLAGLGNSAIAPLRKAATRPSWSGRTSALSALIALQAATKTEVSDFASALATQEGCSFVAPHTSTVCALIKKYPQDQTLRGNLVSAVQRCANDMGSEQLKHLSECDPDLLLSAADSFSSSLATQGDQERLAPVVELLARELVRSPAHARLIAGFLDRGSQLTLIKLLRHLPSQPSLQPEILQAVRAVAERNRDTQEVLLAALRVLAQNADTQYDWAPVIRETLHNCGKGLIQPEVLAVVGQAPADSVLAQVVPALESDAPEKLVGGSLVGAALGAKAIPIVSRLWHLREARPPLVRSIAILALLQINPLTPDLQQEVARILVNRYFPIAAKLPIKWPDTVAVVDMDRSSFGELRKARLAHLLRPTR